VVAPPVNNNVRRTNTGANNNNQQPMPTVGLRDLFTPISARYVNVNTASANVLRLIPGIDENIALAIVQTRSGPDGVDGTEDDTPYRNVGELASVPGFNAQGIGNLQRILSTRSATFLVTVTIEINDKKKDLIAILRRNDQRDVRILMTYWK
jgi:hypothetical protein